MAKPATRMIFDPDTYIRLGEGGLEAAIGDHVSYNELCTMLFARSCLRAGIKQYTLKLNESGLKPSRGWLQARFQDVISTVPRSGSHNDFIANFGAGFETLLNGALLTHQKAQTENTFRRGEIPLNTTIPTDGAAAQRIDLHVRNHSSVSKCISIGHTKTMWVRSTGNGRRGFEIPRENAECTYDPKLSQTFEGDLAAVIAAARADHAAGKLSITDNPLATLLKISDWPPVGVGEDRRLNLDFGSGQYIEFYSLVKTEQGRAYQRRKLKEWTLADGPTPANSMGVGVNVAIVSSDHRFALGVRSPAQGVRGGGIDIGAVEGIRPQTDFQSGKVNLYDVMERALEEEFYITPGDIEGLHLLGFGCDLQYGQWNALGVCYTKKSHEALEEGRLRSAIDARESVEMLYVPAHPRTIFKFLETQKVWSCGLASAYYAMVHMHGQKITDAQVADFAISDATQYTE